MYTLMTNNQRILMEYEQLNIVAVLLLISIILLVIWYIDEHKSY